MAASVPPGDRRGPRAIDPDEVARRRFNTTFRGYDQAEVRAYLEQVAGVVDEATNRIAALERELSTVRATPAPTPKLDEASLTAAVGEETARVLQSAKDAAADIRQKSEENAQRILREAHAEADALRALRPGRWSPAERPTPRPKRRRFSKVPVRMPSGWSPTPNASRPS